MVYFGPELKVPGDLIGLAHLAVIPEKRTLYARRTHTTKLFKPQRRRNHLFFWRLASHSRHFESLESIGGLTSFSQKGKLVFGRCMLVLYSASHCVITSILSQPHGPVSAHVAGVSGISLPHVQGLRIQWDKALVFPRVLLKRGGQIGWSVCIVK